MCGCVWWLDGVASAVGNWFWSTTTSSTNAEYLPPSCVRPCMSCMHAYARECTCRGHVPTSSAPLRGCEPGRTGCSSLCLCTHMHVCAACVRTCIHACGCACVQVGGCAGRRASSGTRVQQREEMVHGVASMEQQVPAAHSAQSRSVSHPVRIWFTSAQGQQMHPHKQACMHACMHVQALAHHKYRRRAAKC